jgi:hypothetical protein
MLSERTNPARTGGAATVTKRNSDPETPADVIGPAGAEAPMSEAVNGAEPPAGPDPDAVSPSRADAPAPPGPDAVPPAATDAPPRPPERSHVPAEPQLAPAPLLTLPDVQGFLLRPLELRVRRLEDTVAELEEHRRREGVRLPPATFPSPANRPPLTPPAPPVPPAAPAPPVAAPAAAPAALPGVPVATLLGAGARMLAAADPTLAERGHHFFLLHEIVAEARAIVRMFVDPRYKLSWWGRLAPLVLVLAFLTSSLWMPWPAVAAEPVPTAPGQPAQVQPAQGPSTLRSVANKVLDLVIGFFLFKILSYEARRYRQTAPDLPPELRL